MVDEAALETPVEDVVLMFYEGAYALILKFADDAGAQVDHLLVVVGELFLFYASQNAFLSGFIEESEHQHGYLAIAEEL